MEAKQSYIPEYEINRYTMAIIPETIDNEVYSRVLEVNGEYMIKKKPLEIIRDSCDYFGCSMQGRKDGTRSLTGITHKAPIMIEPAINLYFFPTSSPTQSTCAWIAHRYVYRHTKDQFDNTLVTFTNQKKERFSISKGSFISQLHRTAQLQSVYSTRMERMLE
ncbi:competence protein ComK [Bacillus timonensis]|nr:competence protein ComK [Bacillus timonensis]